MEQLNKYGFIVRPSANTQREYVVQRATGDVDISAPWDSLMWDTIPWAKLETELYRPGKSSGHLPDTRIKMQYDEQFIYGLFRVEDRYVKSQSLHDQEQVCLDSCVEFFVKPSGSNRYFNFEFSCGGVMLLYDIENLKAGAYTVVSDAECKMVERFHSLPRTVFPEITEPVIWFLGFKIPMALFAQHMGSRTPLAGQVWMANFTKCADATSHPHWLSWQPAEGFHCSEGFGKLIFES